MWALLVALLAPGELAAQTPLPLQSARSPAAPPPRSGSLESIRIRGFLSPSRLEVGRTARVDILLENTHQTTTISPVTIELPQFIVTEKREVDLRGIALPPRSRLRRSLTIVPMQSGPVDVLVQLSTPSDARTEPLARLEVLEPPSWWTKYGASGLSVFLALVAAIVTIWIQLHALSVGKKQKASDSVITIITAQGRDFYFAISGALKGFKNSLELLPRTQSPVERDHLLRRAFFFFGLFLYKENEFAFRHGYLYLANLWAEGAIRRILDEVLVLVPLTRSEEAILHRCFSDAWHLHQDPTIAAEGSDFLSIRTLYDLEVVLDKVAGTVLERRLQEVFASVRPHLADQAKLGRLQELSKAFTGILEYEFTTLFKDWYQGAKGDREVPRESPIGFDSIVGHGGWASVFGTLSALDGLQIASPQRWYSARQVRRLWRR